MTESRLETERLLRARNTLKVIWTAYPVSLTPTGSRDTDVIDAIQTALDQIDLALLHNTDIELNFELTEEDPQ